MGWSCNSRAVLVAHFTRATVLHRVIAVERANHLQTDVHRRNLQLVALQPRYRSQISHVQLVLSFQLKLDVVRCIYRHMRTYMYMYM